ncbi:alpha/beta fold hydrolase [Prauserella muralis]|uniref:Transcriptional regulator n=1 Tax=Prauserella muralis TaxID=588067 RepID=A0A2V4ALB9_9PSEU|nr:alpha/beta fold hydrolase [Prauserella muralis]PXY20773.1 transcriptional regulator [Prauserella muralis]TWE29791.1 lysine decarboxylase transcriptional regulator CadC [Prauserella muralis]
MYLFDDCEVDPQRFELRKAGRPVHVEPQAFALLTYLVRHRDRVVAKTELLDKLWRSRYVSESALTSRVKAVRRAIGDDGQRQRVIATVHGVGYRFVAPVRDTDEPPVARVPQQIRYCTAPDGVRVAYAVSGAGPPLMKAANWLTHLDLEWTNPIWAHWLDTLARGRTLVRYDERGCGLSDWDIGEFSFEAWVDDLACVADAAGLERFSLLGVSQGGAVAIAYAVRHPERVERLVLAGAYSRGRSARAATPEEKEEAELDLQLGRIGWRHEDPTFRQVFASQFLPDADRELWDAFNDLQRQSTSTENVVKFLDVFSHIDVSALAPSVRCPTLVLHSRRDLRVPVSQAIELATSIPDCQLRLLDSGNHIVTADEPAWPVFFAELSGFLDAEAAELRTMEA